MTTGEVYRRIPPYYVGSKGQISYKAFRVREEDQGGLSVDLDLKTAMANLKRIRRLKAEFSGFVLAVLDVARIRTETSAWVRAPIKEGVSHTRIENCASIDVQRALAVIARIVPECLQL